MLKGLTVFASTLALATAASAQAQEQQAVSTAAIQTLDPAFAQFAPKARATATTLDYSIWTEALRSMVVPLQNSIREGAPSVSAGLGTRRVFGHDSRYRLEGNRVGFAFLQPEVIEALSLYRQDLESIGSQIDITKLARNEQLAYWLNLHNVAMIEQIAKGYPLSQPTRFKPAGFSVELDDAKFINVNGVAMSPRDIRTKIVYPNWRSPKVMYGFFHGEIGGPSIQREAFNARNLNSLLANSANEFINSLRGTEKRGKTLHVSKLFEEVRPFYFTNWAPELRSHIEEYASQDVLDMLDKTTEVRATLYEHDIADLSKGERDPSLGNVNQLGPGGQVIPQSVRIPANVVRLMGEENRKIEKIIKSGQRRGTVTFIDIDLPGEEEGANEVE